MEPRDDKADRLADEALLAMMRLLSHQAGGMVTEMVEGDPYDCFDGEMIRLLGESADGYQTLLVQYDRGESAERMILDRQKEILRGILDGQWNILRMALPAIMREMERRSPEEDPEGGLEMPPLGLD